MAACPDTAKAEALVGFLKDRMQADAVVISEFSRLSGGAIQDNFALTVQCQGGPLAGMHEFVVRSDAPSKVAASLSRAHEFQVLKVAFEAGVTVPQPMWMCEDTTVLGAPFCIMTRARGNASGRDLVRRVAENPALSQSLMQQLGAQLARIHGISPVGHAAETLRFLPAPAQVPAVARVQQYRAALDAIPYPHPVLEWALNWLEDHARDSDLRTLCHGDFRTGNYMVDAGRITAILDWEFASWGDPYEDLGWLCARSWRFGAPHREVGGVGDRPDLYAAWEAGTGLEVDDVSVRYWEVMGMVRWAIIALQQGLRHLSGEQVSLELALTGRMVPEMELDILCAIQEFEGKPAVVEAPPPTPANRDEPFFVPHAADLLATARRSLLNDLLPQLPQHTYEALMIANAMAIALREMQDGDRLAAAACAAMQDFLNMVGEGEPATSVSAADPARTLVRLLRQRGVPAQYDERLRELLMTETAARLSLGNPKYLAGRLGAAASATA